MIGLENLKRWRNQYKAVLLVNIISLAHGSATGWLSPTLPLLQSAASPLATGPITTEQASWIGSLLSLGGILGNFIFSSLAEKYGRKFALVALAFPNLTFWLLIIFAKDVALLYLARICAGLTGGGLFVVLPLFVAEIADPQVRGNLNGFMSLTVSVGVLNGYILAAILPSGYIGYLMSFCPIIYLICALTLPETPIYAVKAGNLEGAKKSLWFYKGYEVQKPDDHRLFQEDVAAIKLLMDMQSGEEAKEAGLRLKDFIGRDSRRAILIGFCLCCLCQFCGNFAIVNYAATIFAASGSQMDANVSTIILGVVQIVGTVSSAVLVDNLGRKPLYIVSSAGCVLGLATIGAFTFLHHAGIDLRAFDWVPVTSLSFVIFISSIGVVSLPFVVLTEILPPKIRTIGCSLGMVVISVTAFVILKTMPVLITIIHVYGVMWMFAGCCAVGLVGICLFVPETRGKVLDDGLHVSKNPPQ